MRERAKYEFRMREQTARAVLRLINALDHDGAIDSLRLSHDGVNVQMWVDDKDGLHYVTPIGSKFFELKEVQ